VLPLLRAYSDWCGEAERLDSTLAKFLKYRPTTRRTGRWVFLLR